MDQSVKKYLQIWSDAFASVLSQLGGGTFTGEIDENTAAAAPEVHLTFNLDKALKGAHVFGLARAHALRFAQILLSEPANPEAEFAQDYQDALAELFRQFAGDAAVRWKASGGGEIDIQFAGTDAPAWQASTSATLTIKGDANPLQLTCSIDAALAKAIADGAQPPAAAKSAPAARPEAPTQSESTGNLDLLMDVNLQVKLRFGQRQLPLQELLNLNNGAVVELDQGIDEPAELLLGNKVIARGEVVIVDGNYGLRVTEVASAQQRMASMRS